MVLVIVKDNQVMLIKDNKVVMLRDQRDKQVILIRVMLEVKVRHRKEDHLVEQDDHQEDLLRMSSSKRQARLVRLVKVILILIKESMKM